MASRKQKRKIRTEFRKNYDTRTRPRDFTQQFEEHGFAEDDSARSERVSGKGELAKKRTIIASDDLGEGAPTLQIDESLCKRGRVLRVHGLSSTVETESGQLYQCATSGLLKSISTEQRHVIAAGDHVLIRPANDDEGMIVRVEPRRGIISRTSRGRQHVIVVNVDQLVIVSSAAQPVIKPNLIDRLLVTAEKIQVKPIICINKIDLVDAADLQPLVGVYGQMGYEVILTSAASGRGIEQLKRSMTGKESVVAGQSGVGKSSLLNAIEPGLNRAIQAVSSDSEKGKHTTSTAQLLSLSIGGWVVDTPGIRQFELWDVIAEEVEGFYRDLRPYINRCKFPDCTHTHEADCAVKDAVADGRLDARRYESYCHLFAGDTV